MTKRIVFIFAVILSIVTIFILIGCGSPSSTTSTTTTSTPAEQLSPIKIGHIIDLTGPEAMVGKNFQASLEFAFNSVNNQIDGHPIQIVVGDAKGDSATAADVARQMVENNHVAVIFGPTQQGEKTAVAGYLARVGTPEIYYNTSDLQYLTETKNTVWYDTNYQTATCMADYLINHLGYKSIDTLTNDVAAGHAQLDLLIDCFTKAGGKVIQSQWVPMPCPDFAPYLSTLKPANALVAWVTGSDAVQFLTQYHELGIDKQMPLAGAFHGGFLDPFILAGLPPADAAATVGVCCPMTYAPDAQSDANQAFMKIWSAKFGFPPGDDSASGPYMAASLFIQALQETKGDTTPSTLLNAIFTSEINSVEGPLSFTPGTPCPNRNIYILQVSQVAPNTYGYKTVFTYENVPPSGYAAKK